MNLKKENQFNPCNLGQSLCMNFDAVRYSFVKDSNKRISGALSGYIYDTPQFDNDDVIGGIHYAKYVKLPSSLIPQKQPTLLNSFAKNISTMVKSGASFFDIGPGPEWSVRKNTIPSLKILKPSLYIPVDLEPEFTEEACKVVTKEFPEIEVSNLAINFHKEALPIPTTDSSIIWYPGSTLGNLPSLPNQTFLENKFVVEHLKLLRQGGDSNQKKELEHTRYLIILMDSKKEDIQSMLNLYASDDAIGCFRSILFKLRRDLQAIDFDPNAFIYEPKWNEQSSAVEHTFTATKTQQFKITNCFTGSSEIVDIFKNEQYILANSIKPSSDEMQKMLVHSGWELLCSETDTEKQFHIHLAQTQ